MPPVDLGFVDLFQGIEQAAGPVEVQGPTLCPITARSFSFDALDGRVQFVPHGLIRLVIDKPWR